MDGRWNASFIDMNGRRNLLFIYIRSFMMIRPLVAVGMLVFSVNAHATPLRYDKQAEVSLIDGRPAICLPKKARSPFPIGWATLSEASDQNDGVWSIELKDGAAPLMLKPGDCFSYGRVPSSYAVEPLRGKERVLELRPGLAYVFRLNSSVHSAEAYSVLFCTGRKQTEGREIESIKKVDDRTRQSSC